MAIIKIQQNPLTMYGKELVAMVPKPERYQRRVQVNVADSVVRNREVQPVLDAYAMVVKKPEWIGKTSDEYYRKLHLSLGFIVISMDDGTPPPKPEKSL